MSLTDVGQGRMVRAGIDRVELGAFRRILTTGGKEFLAAAYTDAERERCAGRVERLATRFAAKEAASKALGTGFRGIGPSEIEVVSDDSGEPRLVLHGRARDRARLLGLTSMAVSLSHTSDVAEAFVVAIVVDDGTRDYSEEESPL